MKPSFVVQTTALLLGTTVALCNEVSSALAATFDQKPIDQNQVIAVAVPLPQANRYNLLILQQLSNAKQCWQENSQNGAIEPLLLQFDFTNICGRSTDSNGYSIRIAGEDRALDYHFSIVRQNGHLALMGIPSQKSGNPPIEIARTANLNSGFLKLTLNPGWQFAQRTYQGKALGHIYLTRNTLPNASDMMLASSTPSKPLFKASGSSSSSIPRRQRNLNQASSYNTKAIVINGPIEIPVPAPNSRFPSNGTMPTFTGGVLPVPAARIPMGNAGNESDLITSSTPGLDLNGMIPGMGGVVSPGNYQLAMAVPNYRYRVFVNATDMAQRQKVKTIVPDAFRSSYQGRPMLQVGAFQEQSKADEVIGRLQQHGITTILATDKYVQ